MLLVLTCIIIFISFYVACIGPNYNCCLFIITFYAVDPVLTLIITSISFYFTLWLQVWEESTMHCKTKYKWSRKEFSDFCSLVGFDEKVECTAVSNPRDPNDFDAMRIPWALYDIDIDYKSHL